MASGKSRDPPRSRWARSPNSTGRTAPNWARCRLPQWLEKIAHQRERQREALREQDR